MTSIFKLQPHQHYTREQESASRIWYSSLRSGLWQLSANKLCRLSLQLQSAQGEEKLSSPDRIEKCHGRELKPFLHLSQSLQILAHNIRRLSKIMSDLSTNHLTNCTWFLSQIANPISYKTSTLSTCSRRLSVALARLLMKEKLSRTPLNCSARLMS